MEHKNSCGLIFSFYGYHQQTFNIWASHNWQEGKYLVGIKMISIDCCEQMHKNDFLFICAEGGVNQKIFTDRIHRHGSGEPFTLLKAFNQPLDHIKGDFSNHMSYVTMEFDPFNPLTLVIRNQKGCQIEIKGTIFIDCVFVPDN